MDINQIKRQSSWLQCLYLSNSNIHGKGIFTSSNIQKGEVVITWGGLVFTENDLKTGKVRNHTYVGIAEDLYLASPNSEEPTLDDYMNHSCNGNIWMRDEVNLVARRTINQGEELTADYALWLDKSDYTMKRNCNCGSKLCRRKITGNDWKIRELQIRYRNHFSPFINILINIEN